MAFLQRTPALRLLLAADFRLNPTGTGVTLRSAAVLGTLCANVDTLVGATTEILNPTTPATATVGQQFDATFKVTGTPSEPVSYTISDLPPGLTVPGSTAHATGRLINAASGSITGVPTTAGTHDVTIVAWKRLNATGADYLLTYRIVVGATPAAPLAPSITTQPVSLVVSTGQPALFSIIATGSPAPTYQWHKDGAAIAGASSSSFSIAAATSSDAGSYTAVVSNSAGSATSNAASLTVNTPPPPSAVAPSITTQPVSLTLAIGQSGSLSVIATGSAPLSYQWKKDGSPISGATFANHTLTNVGTADAGNYTVLVSNATGSLTSDTATVTVQAATPTPPTSGGSATGTDSGATPSVTSQPANLLSAPDKTGTFSTSLANDAKATLQWQVSKNAGLTWVALSEDGTHSGTASRSLTIREIDATMNGNLYRLHVRFPNGTLTSDSAMLILPSAMLAQPAALMFDASGNLIVADQAANVILRISREGTITLLSGSRGTAGSSNDSGGLFSRPTGLALAPDGSVFVADSANALVRILQRDGSVGLFAGSPNLRGSTNGTTATFSNPTALAIDPSGSLYVADSANHLIRKITPSGVVSNWAGSAGNSGSRDGVGAEARFDTPSGLACDSKGNLFVSDTHNNTIRRITPTGLVSTVAGLAGVSGAKDGVGDDALFNQPHGLCFGPTGDLFVADTGNSSIRRITNSFTVSTFAGLSSVSGNRDDDDNDDDDDDASSNRAWFDHPLGIACDASGYVYVADTGNHSLRRISADRSVATLSLSLADKKISGTTTIEINPTPPTAPPTTPSTISPSPTNNGGTGGGGAPTWHTIITLFIALYARYRLLRGSPRSSR